MNLENFFNPQSIAIIGSSNDKSKVGFALMTNLLKNSERKIWPISISEKEVLGLPTLPSVLGVPAEVDLAVIAVRSDLVPKILLECAEKKIKSAIVISAGFKELGSAGRELEEKVAEIADQNSIALLGPNCLGVIDTESDFNSTFAASSPLKHLILSPSHCQK
jgi:acetyltransferase